MCQLQKVGKDTMNSWQFLWQCYDVVWVSLGKEDGALRDPLCVIQQQGIVGK